MRFTFLMLFTLLITTSCSFFSAYRAPLQQGNIIESKTVASLRPGMSKQQVIYIMGDSALTSTFDNDRWDYVYSFSDNSTRAQPQHVTLFFKNDRLVQIDQTHFQPPLHLPYAVPKQG